MHSAVEAGDYERDLGVEVRAEVVRGPAGKELKFARVRLLPLLSFVQADISIESSTASDPYPAFVDVWNWSSGVQEFYSGTFS